MKMVFIQEFKRLRIPILFFIGIILVFYFEGLTRNIYQQEMLDNRITRFVLTGLCLVLTSIHVYDLFSPHNQLYRHSALKPSRVIIARIVFALIVQVGFMMLLVSLLNLKYMVVYYKGSVHYSLKFYDEFMLVGRSPMALVGLLRPFASDIMLMFSILFSAYLTYTAKNRVRTAVISFFTITIVRILLSEVVNILNGILPVLDYNKTYHISELDMVSDRLNYFSLPGIIVYALALFCFMYVILCQSSKKPVF